MRFSEILASINGFSVPAFGIQWTPPRADVTIAKDLIKELEDKRVLFNPHDLETADACRQSVEQMRSTLTDLAKQVDGKSHLGKHVQRMRRGARDFCDIVGSPRFAAAAAPVQASLLSRELHKLRTVFGASVGAISVCYGVDVEDQLASIIPYPAVR